jgi:hypothetical protein
MAKRFIPTRVHGVIDHGVASTLLAAPAIFDLPDGSPEGIVPRVVGGAEAIYSNLTDYEMSLKQVVPMPVHLALDGIGGAALALVPQFTGARKRGVQHWLPHLGFGLFQVGLAFFTKTEPSKAASTRAVDVAKVGTAYAKDGAKRVLHAVAA